MFAKATGNDALIDICATQPIAVWFALPGIPELEAQVQVPEFFSFARICGRAQPVLWDTCFALQQQQEAGEHEPFIPQAMLLAGMLPIRRNNIKNILITNPLTLPNHTTQMVRAAFIVQYYGPVCPQIVSTGCSGRVNVPAASELHRGAAESASQSGSAPMSLRPR